MNAHASLTIGDATDLRCPDGGLIPAARLGDPLFAPRVALCPSFRLDAEGPSSVGIVSPRWGFATFSFFYPFRSIRCNREHTAIGRDGTVRDVLGD
jgi:hypothetical protein